MKIFAVLFSIALLMISCVHDGQIKREYSNNKLSKMYWVNKKGEKNGSYIEYHPNGEIALEAHYTNGILHGIKALYYKNGKIKSITHYDSNKVSGKKILYNRSGKIDEITSYKNDTVNGFYYKFYNNGLIKGINKREDSYFNGPQYLYFKNGLLWRYSYFYKDTLVYYKEYDTCGTLVKNKGDIVTEMALDRDILSFNLMHPPCSRSKVVIFEFDNKDTVKTFRAVNKERIEYQIKDTKKNLKILSFLEDSKTLIRLTDSYLFKPPKAKKYFE